jgi:hypothetical protein
MFRADVDTRVAGVYDLREFPRTFMRQAILLAVLLSVAMPVVAQRKHKPEDVKSEEERSASDARSFMELFGKLERDWGLAAEKKDLMSLNAIMAEEFIERDAADPDHPVTRANWLQKRLANYNLDPLQIRSMTIRAFLGNAVVSFVQKQKASPFTRESAEYLIVDVWVVNHGKWQVASRFSSAVVYRNPSDNP